MFKHFNEPVKDVWNDQKSEFILKYLSKYSYWIRHIIAHLTESENNSIKRAFIQNPQSMALKK